MKNDLHLKLEKEGDDIQDMLLHFIRSQDQEEPGKTKLIACHSSGKKLTNIDIFFTMSSQIIYVTNNESTPI